MEISKNYSKKVYDDAIESVENPNHPCHHFYLWQKRNCYSPYQLPEPFSGKQASLGIAFIGLNPSVTSDEIIPCYEDNISFEKYDAYFRNRFAPRDFAGKLIIKLKNGSTKKPKLWNSIENFGNNYLQKISDGVFKLGEHAILSQAIRFKSENGWYGDTQEEKSRTLDHQKKFVEELVENEGINLLVPMGNGALKIISRIVKFDQVPDKITNAMGNSYKGYTNSKKKIVMCPIKHLSYPPSHNIQHQVAEQIITSYHYLNS